MSARPHHPSRGAVWTSACAVGAVVLALTATACSSSPSGPKAADSAAKMSADAKWLAQKERSSNKATTPFTVTQDGTKAVSCGHGKASYTFAGQQTFTIGPVHTYLDVTTVVDAWMKDRGYSIDFDAKPKNDYYTRNSQILVNKKSGIHLTVTATASGEHATTEVWSVSGHTECLRTG
ncbi:hypothetical protein [Actinacidiphila yanglinensis]|uniref:hypothetical protein n=1 Tax=Actinacidiphila yanglinensis TaxID=310779 RepID=UPI0011B0C340|nr:hypothetical protein [Actinacidiphila yanglinensis]